MRTRLGAQFSLLVAVLAVAVLVVANPSEAALPHNGELRTLEINGRWEIVDQNNNPVVWEAVNVRSDQFVAAPPVPARPLSQQHIADLSERFNAIRLSVYWLSLIHI